MTRSSSFSSGLSSPRRGGAMAAARLPPGSAALGAQPGPPAPLVMAAPPRRGPGGTQHCSRRLGGGHRQGDTRPALTPVRRERGARSSCITPQEAHRRGLRCLSAFFPLHPSLLSPLSPTRRSDAGGRRGGAEPPVCQCARPARLHCLPPPPAPPAPLLSLLSLLPLLPLLPPRRPPARPPCPALPQRATTRQVRGGEARGSGRRPWRGSGPLPGLRRCLVGVWGLFLLYFFRG